jgi:hypothetical protein
LEIASAYCKATDEAGEGVFDFFLAETAAAGEAAKRSMAEKSMMKIERV